MSTPGFDYARGTFSSGYNGMEGNAEHTRAVLYVRNEFLVVVDRIRTDRPRNLQALWHYSPDCTVVIEDGTALSTNPGKGNLRVVPAGKILWDVKLVKGQTEPFIQGWYSAEYGLKRPNATAVFTSNVRKSAIFAWVLVPANGNVPKLTAEVVEEDEAVVRVRVEIAGENSKVVIVPLEKGTPVLE